MSRPLPNVEPIRREPLAAEVARRLVDYLLSGGIEPGGRMPSERQLAEAFGVGRSAVREAIAALTLIGLVENGVATPETVDEIVRDGLARRWRYTGPFQTAALGGAETFERVAANLWPVLSDAATLKNLRRWLNEAPEVTGPVRERRDAGLAADLRADRAREGGAGR